MSRATPLLKVAAVGLTARRTNEQARSVTRSVQYYDASVGKRAHICDVDCLFL